MEIWQEEGDTRESSSELSSEKSHGTAVLPVAGSDTEPKQTERNAQFFYTYRACVMTLLNTLKWPALKSQLDLSLEDLRSWLSLPMETSSLLKCFWPNAMRHASDRFLNANESSRSWCIRQPDPHRKKKTDPIYGNHLGKLI
jgi:hypothetical protein